MTRASLASPTSPSQVTRMHPLFVVLCSLSVLCLDGLSSLCVSLLLCCFLYCRAGKKRTPLTNQHATTRIENKKIALSYPSLLSPLPFLSCVSCCFCFPLGFFGSRGSRSPSSRRPQERNNNTTQRTIQHTAQSEREKQRHTQAVRERVWHDRLVCAIRIRTSVGGLEWCGKGKGKGSEDEINGQKHTLTHSRDRHACRIGFFYSFLPSSLSPSLLLFSFCDASPRLSRWPCGDADGGRPSAKHICTRHATHKTHNTHSGSGSMRTQHTHHHRRTSTCIIRISPPQLSLGATIAGGCTQTV